MLDEVAPLADVFDPLEQEAAVRLAQQESGFINLGGKFEQGLILSKRDDDRYFHVSSSTPDRRALGRRRMIFALRPALAPRGRIAWKV